MALAIIAWTVVMVAGVNDSETDTEDAGITSTSSSEPLAAAAGEKCKDSGDCGALKCFHGVCGVEVAKTTGATASKLHWNRLNKSRTNVPDCNVPPGTVVVVLERGAPNDNWPVFLPEPPPGCRSRDVFLHPSRMDITK